MDYSKHESWYILLGDNPYYLPWIRVHNDNKKIEDDVKKLCENLGVCADILNIEFHNCVKENGCFSIYYKAFLPHEFRISGVNKIYYKEFSSTNVLIPEKGVILRGI